MENVEVERATCTVTRKPDEDLALVQAVRTGDMSAFEKLLRKYDRKLLRIALNVLHNVEDAEDAVQEAFVKAYQKLDQFRADAKFSTWLTRIVLNQSFMKLRKQRTAREQSIDTDFHEKSGNGLSFDLADWAPNPEQLYTAGEFRQILIKCLRTLPPGQRSVFILRDIEGLSTLDAAEILHLTQTTVKSQLSRARLELRERLSKYFKARHWDLDFKQLTIGRMQTFGASDQTRQTETSPTSHQNVTHRTFDFLV